MYILYVYMDVCVYINTFNKILFKGFKVYFIKPKRPWNMYVFGVVISHTLVCITCVFILSNLLCPDYISCTVKSVPNFFKFLSTKRKT